MTANKQSAPLSTMNRAFELAAALHGTGVVCILSLIVAFLTMLYVFVILPVRALNRAVQRALSLS